MKIKATIERIPGGMMLVPLVLGAILNTLAPNTGAYFGGFTKGMITGTVPILAVWFFCIGASINLRATGTVLRKSGTLVITKIAVAWVVAMICAMFIPENGIQTGFFAGLSVLAIVSAMDMTNGGLYASWDRDQLVAEQVANYHQMPCYHTDLVLEGGSIHVDGEGTLLTTAECLLNANRNPNLSKAQIEQQLRDYLGVSQIIWLPDGVFNDETDGHIDNMCCFVRPGEVALH